MVGQDDSPRGSPSSKDQLRKYLQKQPTQHKNEAEELLEHAVNQELQTLLDGEEEKLDENGDADPPDIQRTMSPLSVRSTFSIPTSPSQGSAGLRSNRPRSRTEEMRKSTVRRHKKNTLSDATEYLLALHQTATTDSAELGTPQGQGQQTHGSRPRLPTGGHDKEADQSLPLEETHAMDRIHKAGTIFKAAAAFKSGIKSHKTIPPVDQESSEDMINSSDEMEYGSQLMDRSDRPRQSHFHRESMRQEKSKVRYAAIPNKARKALGRALAASKEEWHSLNDFFSPKTKSLRDEVVFVVCACLIPCLLVACILFYFFENPPTGRCRNNPDCATDSNGNPTPSASYWVLFLGVRQVMTFVLAKGLASFFVDYLLLQHSRLVRLLGARLSLLWVQSRGWPGVLFLWAVLDFSLVSGQGEFHRHWLFWQETLRSFTDDNPSGSLTSQEWYRRILIIMIVVAAAVSVKRYIMGLYLGRRLFVRFQQRLMETMKEVTLISELAVWVRRKRDQKQTFSGHLTKMWNEVHRARSSKQIEYSELGELRDNHRQSRLRNPFARRGTKSKSGGSGPETPPGGGLVDSVKDADVLLEQLLDTWEEPKKNGFRQEDVSGGQVVMFRQAYSVLRKPCFFSSAFGPVETREECYVSADYLYRRLLKLFEESHSIELSSITQWMYKGMKTSKDKENAAQLALLLNADNDGMLNIIDFVKGIDSIYQRVRTLENAINNASHIDREYEKVINIAFSFVLFCVSVAIYGVNPLNFILSLTGFFFAFAFMFGSGASVYFEGVMMILARKPYDVGDRIGIASIEQPADMGGSMAWVVESVDLNTTTARLPATGELASYSNGSLARSRLMNMNRSPNGIVYVFMRFPTDTAYSTIMIFKSAVERFVAERPSEWKTFLGFRNSRIEAQENFVEYMIIIQHHNSWQDIGPILDSKAALASFCVELQKQLGCRYDAPAKPIEITMPSLEMNNAERAVDEKEKNEASAAVQASINSLIQAFK